MRKRLLLAALAAGLLWWGVATEPSHPAPPRESGSPCECCECQPRWERATEQTAELTRRIESAEAYAGHLRDYVVWRFEPGQRDEIAKRRGLRCPEQASSSTPPSTHAPPICSGGACRRVGR